MFYYGGGYCDIKEILHSWSDAFDLLNSREEKSGIGYPEIVNGVAKIHSDDEFRAMDVYNFNVEMRRNYKKLIGNGAYIFKPKSLIFEFLLKEQERRIRKHQEELKRFPGNVLGNNEGYPLGWSYLLGEIFHPIVLCRYTDVIQRNELRPSFHNYR